MPLRILKTSRQFWRLGLFAALCLGLQACPYDREYNAYEGVYMTRGQLESSIKAVQSRIVQKPSRVFAHGSRLYFIEQFKGVHVFNNADPQNPASLAFVVIPGLTNAGVQDSVLVADSGPDLVGIDIADPQHSAVLWRKRDVLTPMLPPSTRELKTKNMPQGMIVVEWK